MVLFWLLWVSLALGGLAGAIYYRKELRDKWLFRVARVPAPARRPVTQKDRLTGRFRGLGGPAGLPPRRREPPGPAAW